MSSEIFGKITCGQSLPWSSGVVLHPCFSDLIWGEKKKKGKEVNGRIRERTARIAPGIRGLESVIYMEQLKENFSKVF